MRVARAEWNDWYVDDDRSAVFVAGQVVVLSHLATRLLTHVDGEVTLEVLADLLVAEFGRPEGLDAVDATGSAVRELLAQGVLREVGTGSA